MAQGQARGADSFLPRSLHVIEIHGLDLVDLSVPGLLGEVGLTLDDVSSDDWSACQEVGQAVYFLNYQGLRAPSATGLGTTVAVFETRVGPDQLEVTETRPISAYL